MRQSTLAFGQRPLNIPPPINQPLQSAEEVKDETNGNLHLFFAKRNRAKEEQKSQKKGENVANPSISTSNDLQPPTKKRMLNGVGKNTTAKSKQPLTPWPGRGESLVEPENHSSSFENRIDQLTAFEKRADAFREETDTTDDERTWSWLHSSKEFEYQNQGENETQNGRHITTDKFIESQIDFESCLNSNGELPTAIEDAKLTAKSRQNDHSSQLWIDKWRPKYAEQSLGNEKYAIYMRDWLETLKVADRPSNGTITGPPLLSNKTQSRQIIKRAQKKRGRPPAMKEMDDFIVGDTAEEEAWFDQFRKTDVVNSEVSQDQSASIFALADQDDLDFRKSNRLTNVMVIEGPSGCGKTASVYACANELGYEVFEIYPGMGKRSGVNLSAMVGDLCRNHMVSSGGTGGGAFQGKLVKNASSGTNDNVQISSSSNGLPNTLKARQSLILVEEADTMYEDDKGFWLGLIELASESLRPIILTCNDLTAIPIQSLPIQKILQYSKPSAAHLVPYLQLIALSEGYQVNSDLANRFYLDTVRIEEQLRYAEQLLLPMHGPIKSTSIDDLAEGKGDLRQTIMQLQYDCKGKQSPSSISGNQDHPKTLRQLIRSADLKSFADSVFARPFDRAVAELEFEQFAPNPDNVQTMGKEIYTSPSKGVETCLPIFGRELDYISSLSANQYNLPMDYHHRRATLSKDIESILESQNVSVQSRLFSLEAILDHAPFIHKMVIIDDQEEDVIKTSVETMLQEGAKEEVTLIAKGYNRQKINFIRKQDRTGLLDLLVRETNFLRWLLLHDQQLEQARRIAPSLNW